MREPTMATNCSMPPQRGGEGQGYRRGGGKQNRATLTLSETGTVVSVKKM